MTVGRTVPPPSVTVTTWRRRRSPVGHERQRERLHQLSGSFTDPGTQDTHTVMIAWGDGSTNTTLNLAAAC